MVFISTINHYNEPPPHNPPGSGPVHPRWTDERYWVDVADVMARIEAEYERKKETKRASQDGQRNGVSPLWG